MIVRVSSKMSLIAAQISSFDTRITSSTVCRAMSNVRRPTDAHRDAVRENPHVIERDALARLQRPIHRVRFERFDANHFHARAARALM